MLTLDHLFNVEPSIGTYRERKIIFIPFSFVCSCKLAVEKENGSLDMQYQPCVRQADHFFPLLSDRKEDTRSTVL